MTTRFDRPSPPAAPAPSGSRSFDFDVLTSEEFAQARFTREWLVEDVLVADQLGVIGGPKKALKTSIATDLAISLGSGTSFLGYFPVPRARGPPQI